MGPWLRSFVETDNQAFGSNRYDGAMAGAAALTPEAKASHSMRADFAARSP